MSSQAQKVQVFTSSEALRQDMAEPARQGETESARANQLTLCYPPALCTYPSFVKTVRRCNIGSRGHHPRMEVPATFVKKHGHSFQATVALQGSSGRLMPARLRIRCNAIQARVQFAGAQWRAFVLENDLQVGHQLRFSLISKSTFQVRHLDSSTASSVNKSSKKPSLEPRDRIIRNNSACHGLLSVPEMSTVEPSAEVFAMTKNDVVYVNAFTSRVKEEVDSMVKNLQCPHFVTKIGKSNIREYRSSSLSVPREFFKKYGKYFSRRANIFQGPSGRLLELCFAAGENLRFTTGWKTFRENNDIQLGDVLLFSLRAPARWLVQVVNGVLESSESEKSYGTEPTTKVGVSPAS